MVKYAPRGTGSERTLHNEAPVQTSSPGNQLTQHEACVRPTPGRNTAPREAACRAVPFCAVLTQHAALQHPQPHRPTRSPPSQRHCEMAALLFRISVPRPRQARPRSSLHIRSRFA